MEVKVLRIFSFIILPFLVVLGDIAVSAARILSTNAAGLEVLKTVKIDPTSILSASDELLSEAPRHLHVVLLAAIRDDMGRDINCYSVLDVISIVIDDFDD